MSEEPGGIAWPPRRWVRTGARLWRRSRHIPPAAGDAAAGDPLQAARNRRLIFVISTGRSGTEYLAQVLALFRDVYAVHEPEPSFTGAFRTIVNAPQVARQFWLDHKLPAIARTSAPIYAETSHLACKGFLESAVEVGLRPALVHLVRPYRQTARSMLALNTIPSRTYNGVRFYLGPDDRVFLPVDRSTVDRWHDYQLCYWYCLEIGERARVYAEMFKPAGIAVHRVELDAVGTVEGIETLGRLLDLGPLSKAGATRLTEIGSQRTNQKSNAKRQYAIDDEQLARWESEVEEAVAQGKGSLTTSGAAV